jgi:hypothetical protein
MIWSISESKTFRRCQRQWYYKNCVANAIAKKDPIRRKAYLLGKLQTISAWRGQIVDSVISDFIVPALNAKRGVTLKPAKAQARELFDTQLACARAHRLHEPDLSVTALGNTFAAFYCMEYGGEIPEDELMRAWPEIDIALTNLFQLRELADSIKAASYLVAQRALCFQHSGATVRAVPDLIAFYDAAPPAIIDWKVHAFGIQEAWLQLGAYAVALASCKPHKDFPFKQGRWTPTDFRLVEAQLLTRSLREHKLTEETLEDIDDYIADSVTQMHLAVGNRNFSELTPEDFPVAAHPETCQRCPYRKICWEAP